MSHPSDTTDFRWTDGSVVIWALWIYYNEPNSQGEQAGMIYEKSKSYVYNDVPMTMGFRALCEKTGRFIMI